TTLKAHFFGVNGIGLKVVANAGAGFSWRDPDPGGLNSQTWWDLAVHDPDPQVRESSRTRVMEYNEDDVKATLAVRRWLAERPSE
ncbi:ribonuclease H-like domain-containing protein, partial [Streptomyces sp. MAG02]|nr:ribonuclease H-like domain-containing protein [Streptomyces sp. MAG02]